MMPRRSKRILIIGWDAADWDMLRPLFSAGAMPHLKKLMDRGTHADLATLEPKLSPMLWSSVATGKTADKHGILNFVEPDPAGAGLRPVASTTRRTKALWNMLTHSAMRVNAVAWYASHPAEPISGACVSNLLQEAAPQRTKDPWPLHDAAVHPREIAAKIAAGRMHPQSVAAKTLLPMVPQLAKLGRGDERIQTLSRLVAQCLSVHSAVMTILNDDHAWDCTMVFHEAIDTVGHHFMQYHPPRMEHVPKRDHDLFRGVMAGIYALHDRMLGEMLQRAGDDTTIILLSDHGFHSDHLRPATNTMTGQQRAAAEASWHRQHGVLVMAGPGITAGTRIAGASLLDITPTALTLLGLPPGRDMDGRVLWEAMDAHHAIDTIESWDQLPGDPAESGMHPPDLRQDPFEARDAVQQLIDLGYMAALPEDAHAQIEMVRRETQFNLGMVLMTRGRHARAAEIFTDLVRALPNESRYVLCLGRSLLGCMRPAEAADALKAFLDGAPSNIDASCLLAASLIASQHKDEALALVRRLERDQLSHAASAQSLGELFVALHCWDDAARHFQRALAHDPRSARAHAGLAQTALGQGRFEQAAEHALDAAELQHLLPEAHHLLGVALTWLDDPEHAMQSFRATLAQQPGHLDAHRFLAAILRSQGKKDDAAAHEKTVERLLSSQELSADQLTIASREGLRGPSEWMRRGAITPLQAPDA